MRVLVVDTPESSSALLKKIEQQRPEVIVIDARLLKSILEELAERKLVERAKGLLMKARGLDEESAFALLRKAAMDRKLKLAEVAQLVIDAPRWCERI